MANWYVYSGAAGTGTGVDWTNAMTTLSAALSAAAAGDDIYVAHDHAETGAVALTLSPPSSASATCRVMCVNRAGSVPPIAADLRTTGQITTTGASTIVISGSVYAYGLVFNAGTGTSAANFTPGNAGGNVIELEACTINLLTTSANSQINVAGANNIKCRFRNVVASFGNTGQGINPTGKFYWCNDPATAWVSGTPPANLFSGVFSGSGETILEGLDLSGLSGLCKQALSGGHIELWGCKIPAGWTVTPAMSALAADNIDFFGCASDGNPVNLRREHTAGVITTERTIVRNQGANDGLTSYSLKIVTTADARPTLPFRVFEIPVDNQVIGQAITRELHLLTDGVTLTNADIHAEVDYYGTSGSTQTSRLTTAPATPLTVGANLASSSVTWVTTGLTSPTKQKIALTFTPQVAGVYRIKLFVKKPSTTLWLDPFPEAA